MVPNVVRVVRTKSSKGLHTMNKTQKALFHRSVRSQLLFFNSGDGKLPLKVILALKRR